MKSEFRFTEVRAELVGIHREFKITVDAINQNRFCHSLKRVYGSIGESTTPCCVCNSFSIFYIWIGMEVDAEPYNITHVFTQKLSVFGVLCLDVCVSGVYVCRNISTPKSFHIRLVARGFLYSSSFFFLLCAHACPRILFAACVLFALSDALRMCYK